MQLFNTKISGLKIVRSTIYKDKRGFLKEVYKKIDIAPNSALLTLILYKIAIPPMVNVIAKINAKVADIRPVGKGLFMVLFIKESVSFSIT